MKKSKKNQDDAVRAYREYIEHLKRSLADKRLKIEKLEALRDRLLADNSVLREDAVLLEADNARLAAENDALKGHGRLFTDLPGKAERLERQLNSALERVDELSEKNETLQKRYDEAAQAVKELTDERDALNEQVKSMRHDLMTRFKATKEEGQDDE